MVVASGLKRVTIGNPRRDHEEEQQQRRDEMGRNGRTEEITIHTIDFVPRIEARSSPPRLIPQFEFARACARNQPGFPGNQKEMEGRSNDLSPFARAEGTIILPRRIYKTGCTTL